MTQTTDNMAQATKLVWICNQCGSPQYTGSVSEEDIQRLACSDCGGDEFHKTAANILQISFDNNPSGLPSLMVSCSRGDTDKVKSIINFTHGLFKPRYEYVEGVATHILGTNDEGFDEVKSLNNQ